MAIEIHLSHDPAILLSLEQEWQILQANSAATSLFMTWDWLSAWWGAFGQGELWLLTAREDERLIGLAPLMLTHHHEARGVNWKQLEFMGAAAPVDHWDMIIERGREQEVVALFIAELTHDHHEYDVLEFANILPDSPTLDALRQSNIHWVETDGHDTPYIHLASDFESYFASLSSNKRQQQRRYLRKLDKAVGHWDFQAVQGEAVAPAFYEMVAHHQVKWTALGEPGAFADLATVNFHLQLAKRFDEKGWLRLYRLVLDSYTAGIFYMFCYRGRMSYFNSGLSHAFDHLSIGHILHEQALRAAFEEDVCEYDFMWGDERYKFDWGAQPRTDRVLTWYASVRAKALHGAVELVRSRRRTFKSAPKTDNHD